MDGRDPEIVKNYTPKTINSSDGEVKIGAKLES